MLTPIILGEVITCEMCNNIKVKQYRWETPPSIRSSIIGYCEKYLHHSGVCQECIEKYHYKVLSQAQYRLIHEYQKQVDTLKKMPTSFIERSILYFSQTISKEGLEELNPKAVEHYKNDTDYDELSMKYLPARRYLAEIEPDIIAWIQKDASKRIAESQKYICAEAQLTGTEKKVKSLLGNTENYLEYCLPDPVRMLRHSLSLPIKQGQQIKEICKDKRLVSGNFYQHEKNLKKQLQEMVNDSKKYEICIEEQDITNRPKFHEFMDKLPVRITENHFWR